MALIAPDDTAKVNRLIRKGRQVHFSAPDSAISYYRQVFDNLVMKPEDGTIAAGSLEQAYFESVIRALNYTGNIYYYDDQYQRSEYYYQRSLDIAERTGLDNYRGRAFFDIGYVRYVNNNYSEARKLFEKSYRVYEETGNTAGKYDALHACGLANRRLGEYETADSCFKQALDIAVRTNDSVLIADVMINSGILLCEQGDLEEGIVQFEEALDVYEKMGQVKAVSLALLNIGVVLKMVGEYDKALDYMRRSTAMEERLQHKSQLVVRYYNLADLYLDMGESQKAYEYCLKIRSVANEIGSRPFTAECNFLMGRYHFLENDFSEAVRYFSAASDSAARIKNKPLIANIHLWLARTFVSKSEPAQAIRHAVQAYENATDMRMLILQKEASQILSQAFENAGNAKEALNWHKTFLVHSDSLSYFNQQKEIKGIEARYNFEKKEQENQLLRQEASLQAQKLRNRSIVTIALIVGIALSAVVIFLLIRRNHDARLLHEKDQILNLQKLTEIEYELDGKKRELASKLMFLNQKNELINRIITELQDLQNSPDHSLEELNDIVSELKIESPQSNWKEFETQFTQVHPDFYKRLYEKHPDLTSYEQRICAFLRMNLNSKEISAITGRSLKSIEVTRSRIRKKLRLGRSDNLNSFLASV